MKLRLLIVEDEDAISFAVGRYLRGRGFEVDCAGDLSTALALVTRHQYAAVIADLRLTGARDTEGLEVLTEVRRSAPACRTILLTAYRTAEIEAESIRLGVDLTERKPMRLSDLAQKLEQLLGLPQHSAPSAAEV